jgi:hypothetical protein
MAEVMQLDERRHVALSEKGRGRLRSALGFLVPGLVWYALIGVTWLIWWQVGPEGRETIAGTMGLSANQFGLCLWPFLIFENILAKGLLIAAFYQWVQARRTAA